MALAPVPANPANIARAADALRRGRLVAFPTETVYGLGADACNGEAVAEIFAAKGRPSFNPLIVHVQSAAAAERIARFTPAAWALARAFWPGGLTLVLDRQPNSNLSDLVSAGLPSVAVRVPSHPIAQQLIESADCPIAAPSANRSGHVSATTAAHVASDFADSAKLEVILDDGPCPLGLESTIVDARGEGPILLRPGAVTSDELATVLGAELRRLENASDRRPPDGAAPRTSPGQLESHYAPGKPVFLDVTHPHADQAWLTFGAVSIEHLGPAINLSASGDLIEASANLFAALRELDDTTATSIAVTPIPETGLGQAINDRLRRAAAPR